MTNERSANGEVPFSADAAFVVHLMETEANEPETVRGRIEHISSGRSTQFTSVAELVGFMRDTLAFA